MTEYADELIRDLLRDGLSSEEIEGLQRHEKDADRFAQVLRLEQERLRWRERILLCLQEHLYIVDKGDGSKVVRCDCGQEFGDYRRNWKESALVYERAGADALAVYRGPRVADPDWSILREFYCPGCATQLDVEVVPRGYPFIFNVEPDFEAFEGGEQ
ncbi:MAG TPA: acetone carboxylase subunit gamma [Acidimicrobiales bacterium]|nr:acetone carboxylase subunit gamma [Acidimicrobiales bacterium]